MMYTKGEWKFKVSTGSIVVKDKVLAWTFSDHVGRKEADANGYILGAAKDLYEAATLALREAMQLYDDEVLPKWLIPLAEAITKAEKGA